ncbi:MAG: NUDIX domain-containing protein [Actinomycetota bacterium]|nr:NUDIX domain-containing protein [Actinomycetota bacterium]
MTGGVTSRPPGNPRIPAATVVPLRDGPEGLEVLLLRRSSRGTFGGMWVFPGGQVDPADLPGDPDPDDEIPAARAAAVREAHEEAAMVLDPASLVVLSFWYPPPEAPRRFATWFFLAPAHEGPDIVVDQVEIHEHQWMRPGQALRRRDAGEIELAPPTFMTLWWLDQQHDTWSALRTAAAGPPPRFETHMAASPTSGLAACLWAGDAGYDDSDMDRPGSRRRLVLDPGGWRAEVMP